MSNSDVHLREAALAWAKAHRARVAATSLKRKTFADARNACIFSQAREADTRAAKAVTEARAAERAAAKRLLAIVDPNPVTLRGCVSEVRDELPKLASAQKGLNIRD